MSNEFDGTDIAEVISVAYEYREIAEFMDDTRIDTALMLLVNLLEKPQGPPPAKVASLIVELQSVSTHCAIKATYYQTIGKSEQDSTHKKNLYYTFREAFGKLADSVKYLIRSQM